MKLSSGSDVGDQLLSFIAGDFITWYNPLRNNLVMLKNHSSVIPSNLGTLFLHSVLQSCPTRHPHKDSVAPSRVLLHCCLSYQPTSFSNARPCSVLCLQHNACLIHSQRTINVDWIDGRRLETKTEMKTIISWKNCR